MALGFATTLRTARAQKIIDACDAGSGSALIRFYDGARPATGGTATTLLAELTCSKPSFTVASGTLTLATVTQDSDANATGTATWFRVVDSAATFVFDGNVTATGGSGDLTINSTSITIHQRVSITGGTISEGNI